MVGYVLYVKEVRLEFMRIIAQQRKHKNRNS
jgi:hypothetical protein